MRCSWEDDEGISKASQYISQIAINAVGRYNLILSFSIKLDSGRTFLFSFQEKGNKIQRSDRQPQTANATNDTAMK